MLVLISDLHLTDGTSGSTISPGAFQLLADRLTDLGLSASRRRDGSYRPIERVDLVLLGDVLDIIRSTQWLQQPVRPWDDPKSRNLFDMVAQITASTLRHNELALGEFRKLAEQGISIPLATREGQPADRETQPIPVRIHYMVGNHDWFYHLPGENYNQLRRQIAAHMGLATYPDAPFPHEIWESNELVQVMRQHKVFARHGDVYDPFNYEGDRDASSLGDVIVVELLNRFGVQVMQELGDELSASALAGLREIDNIRPLLLIPVWIDGLLERCCPQPALRKEVKRVWDELAEEFLAHPFVRQRDTWCPVDIVDGLQKALKFSRRLSVGWASWIAQWIAELRGAGGSSYYPHALTEQDFRNRRAKHIVYGHTHHAEVVPLDASYADGYVLHQAYFNSGTWRRVHQQTQFAPREHEFIAADTLTYLAFFKEDERSGRPYETWTGTLGVHPFTTNTHRFDAPSQAGTTPDGPSQPLSTPNVPLRAPHFAVPLAPGSAARRSPSG
ncbi:MAG: metallophosphoesterase [Pirellulales bacterium]|nr:metallophosphoesterase [Pirellulales bacterium]